MLYLSLCNLDQVDGSRALHRLDSVGGGTAARPSIFLGAAGRKASAAARRGLKSHTCFKSFSVRNLCYRLKRYMLNYYFSLLSGLKFTKIY